MNVRALCLPAILALLILTAASAFAQETPPAAPENIRVNVTGGFAGWAVPVPDFAAHIIVRGETAGASSRLAYNDISLTPLHVSIRGNVNAATCTITVRNRATTLRMPTSAAFMLEPGATPPAEDTAEPAASLLERHEFKLPAGGADYWLPMLLYPSPPDLALSAVEVEVVVGSAAPVKETASFNYLPRGKVFGLLLEAEGRGMLPPVKLPSLELRFANQQLSSGYNQQFQLLSVSPNDIGPDFRVLRHFAYIFVSANYWQSMPPRAREIVSDAAGMGGKLVIFGAKQPVAVGKQSFQPQATASLQPFGFGEALVSTLADSEIMPQVLKDISQRLAWAHNLAIGETNWEAIGAAAARDVELRSQLNEPIYNAWMISLSDILPEKRSLNPYWALEYQTRAGLMHPMDKPEYHWQGISVQDASRELVDMSTYARREWVSVHGSIDNGLRRPSAHNLTRAAVWFTLLVLAAAAICFIRGYSNFALAAALLALSAVAIGVFALRIEALLPGAVKTVVISTTMGSAQSDISETRSVAYVYSPYATALSLKMPYEGNVLSRISPMESDSASISAVDGEQFTLERLKAEPLLPTEASFSAVSRGDSPVECVLAPARGGEQKLTVKCGSEPVKLLCLVNGTRMLYLGSAEPNESRTVILPAGGIPPTLNDADHAMDVARSAINDLLAEHFQAGRVLGDKALRLTALESLAGTMRHDVLRGLITEGRGITVMGIRQRTVNLGTAGGELMAPSGDLFVYRLK